MAASTIGAAAAGAATMAAVAGLINSQGASGMSISSIFGNLFGSSTPAPVAPPTGSVVTGSITFTDAQLKTLLSMGESAGWVVVPTSRAAIMAMVEQLQLIGLPIDQAIVTQLLAQAKS